jgi:hypothetical protein
VDKRMMVLPAVVLVLGMWVAGLRGPFHYGDAADPEYPYLLNALSVLTLQSPGHVDHPGTTLQVGLAGVVLLRHAAGCALGEQCVTLPVDVLTEPEKYLRAANMVLLVLMGLVVYGSGVFVRQQTGAVLPAVMLQGMLFTFPIVTYSLGRVSPEPVMTMVALLYLAPFLAAALRRAAGREWGEREMEWMAVGTGVLLAVGVVTKITFIPLAVMALALPGWRLRGRHAAAAIASAVVLLAPVWEKIPMIARWVSVLLSRSGQYGSGEAGLPTGAKLAENAAMLFDKEPMYWVWLAAAAAAGWAAKAVRREALLAVAGAVVMLLLTVKHPHQRYLLPGMALLTFTAALLAAYWRTKRAAVAVMGVLGLLALGSLQKGMEGWIGLQMGYAGSVERFKGMAGSEGKECTVYHYYGSSDPVGVLQFGDAFSEAKHRGLLEALYPGFRFYNFFTGRFEDFEGRDHTPEVAAKVAKGGCVLLQGQGEPSGNWPSAWGLRWEELGRGGSLVLRRVTYDGRGQPAESTDPGREATRVEAGSMRAGNAVVDRSTFAHSIAVLTTPQPPGWAEFEAVLPGAGLYEVRARYATEQGRPVRLLVNGNVVLRQLGRLPTGGYGQDQQKWTTWGEHELPGGKVTVRLESESPFPHIHEIAFVPVKR